MEYLFLLLFIALFILQYSKAEYSETIFEIPKIDANKFLKSEVEVEKKPTSIKSGLKIKTIDDLPTFLQQNKFKEKEGLCIVNRYLLSQDIWIKKYGGVFDQSNFDGLSNSEPLSQPRSLEWNAQRARSAANLWVSIINCIKYNNSCKLLKTLILTVIYL